MPVLATFVIDHFSPIDGSPGPGGPPLKAGCRHDHNAQAQGVHHQGFFGRLILLHQQVAGFGPHEHGPLGHQAQQELMVPAARPGQFGDDLGLSPAHRQTVLVEAHPVKRQGQGINSCLDIRPDLVNGRSLAGQSGAARFLKGGPGRRLPGARPYPIGYGRWGSGSTSGDNLPKTLPRIGLWVWRWSADMELDHFRCLRCALIPTVISLRIPRSMKM